MKIERERVCFAQLFKFINFTAVFVIVIILTINSGVFAQKGKSNRKIVKKKTIAAKTKEIVPSNELCIPQQSDFVSVLQIDSKSNLTLTARQNGESKVLFDSKPLTDLKTVLSGVDKESFLVVQPNSDLTAGTVTTILKSARLIVKNCINVEASTKAESPYVYIFSVQKDNKTESDPNPLVLLVEAGKNGNISMNGEKLGSIKDLTKLADFLKQIFQSREKNSVYTEETNEIEAMVSVKVSPTAKFADVIKIVDVLKEIGAKPIGFIIDNNSQVRTEIIQNIMEIPAH
jgi:biopolymer transport protein ExbD